MSERSEQPHMPFDEAPESEKHQQTPETIFETYFPDKLKAIGRSNVPPQVMEFFEGRSRIFAPDDKEYAPENFDGFYIIHRDDGVTVYIATQHREEMWGKQPNHRTRVHFYELLEDNSTGYGTIEYKKDALIDRITKQQLFYTQKPYVVIMNTYDGPTLENGAQPKFTRQGYGTKRLQTMGAYSLAFFAQQLYSGNANKQGRALFESMIEKGMAEEVDTGDKTRKHFRMALKPITSQNHKE